MGGDLMSQMILMNATIMADGPIDEKAPGRVVFPNGTVVFNRR